jgi:hypothetical protein
VGSPCTVSSDCSSDYCKNTVCACNSADATDPFECHAPTDCCAGSTCTAGFCVAATSGGTGGGVVCKSWTGTAPPTGYDSACNGNDGGIDSVCSATGVCVPNCTITAAYCTAGETCEANGHCSAAGTSGGSTGAASTGGGTSGGGTTTGGNGGGTTGLATACTGTINDAEFDNCDAGFGTSLCPTGLTCYNDPNFGPYCAYACTSTASCPDLQTNCEDGGCAINVCGVAAAAGTNGTFDGTCSSAAAADGTCFPIDASALTDGGPAQYGVCLQGGSITNDTAACSLDVSCAANDLCGPTWFCNTTSTSTTVTIGNCVQLCDPTTLTGCATGSTCEAQSTDVGVCQPNTSGGSTGGGTTGGGTSGGGTSGGSTSGGTTGGTGTISTADMCTVCTTDSSCSTGNYCVVDGDGSSLYCAPNCKTGTCPSGTTCFSDTDESGRSRDICYPNSETCDNSTGGTSGGSGGGCGVSGTDTGQNGATCSAASDCCSQYCVTSGTCACNNAAGTITCTSNTTCNPTGSAGGVCNSGTCSFPCASDADCCSTNCSAGFCQ